MISITIYDPGGESVRAHWSGHEFSRLEFTSEDPGGHISASFVILGKYELPYKWLDFFNRVVIRSGEMVVWRGYIWAAERYWTADTSGIRVECLGDVGRLAGWTLSENLSNEKASTYIVDHIITHTEFTNYLTVGAIDTKDYTIPGTREYKPRKTIREIMEDLHSFNTDTHTWQVWDGEFSWSETGQAVSYITNTGWCTGSVRQDLADFTNYLYYSYRDASGVIQEGAVTDSDSPYPRYEAVESYSDNMGSSQASQLASSSLSERKKLGATSEISVWRAVDTRGREVRPCELRPGRLIRIDGLVPARATPTEAYVENNYNVFVIRSVTYTHDDRVARVGPGKLPHSLPRVIGGKR